MYALPNTDVKLYFPSEYGVDHRKYPFAAAEWVPKKDHFETAQELFAGKIKICRVFVGLLLEDSIGPWFGYDTKNGIYEAVGSTNVRSSFTSKDDVGKVLATLSSMLLANIPEAVHISGDNASFEDIAAIMYRAGAGKVEVKSRELEPWKKWAIEAKGQTPENYLRFLMGEEKIDHRVGTELGCDNEVVNPGQKIWRWRTLADLATDTRGRPFKESAWPSV